MRFFVLATLALGQDPAGTPEQLAHWRLARSFAQPDRVTEAAEAAGISSPRFETRYAAILVKLHRTLSNGRGFEALHKAMLALPAEGAAQAHLAALAESVKKAVACGPCGGAGKIACDPCKGQGKRDVTCKECKGEGRVKPTGAVGGTNITLKCRNCDGNKVFKNARCPDCAGAAKSNCTVPDCRGGRVPCAICKGAGKAKVDCPDCEGGRIVPKGATGGTDLSTKCRRCEKKPDGKQGDGTLEEECKACARSGRITCKTCGGKMAKKDGSAVDASSFYRAEKCADCRGAGFPDPAQAKPCPACLGLGQRILPASDPSKTLR
jgi:hypothetical protein